MSRVACAPSFFSAGVETISRVFFWRRYFVPGILHFWQCWRCLLMRIYENGTTCHNSGFPAQGQVWGTLSSKFGCGACRVPCDEMPFISKKKKKQAADRNSLVGAILSSRTPVRTPACVPFFFVCPFFFVPICSVNVVFFAQILYVLTYLSGTALLIDTPGRDRSYAVRRRKQHS